jgi:drug/metabolite transporter (DMT)-like permease
MHDMVAAGMVVAAGAGVCFEVSYLLQAIEARAIAPERTATGVLGPLLRRPRWLLGLALAAAGTLLQVFALHLAPITAVQPTLALGIVGLVVFGGRLLGEPADLAAALVLAGGVALLGIAGSGVEHEPVHDVAVAITFVVLGGFLAAALLRPRLSPVWLVLGAGAGDALVALAAARLADALDPFDAVAAIGWFVLAGLAVTGSLSAEMTALGRWPATRVGPFVLVCQTVIPILLAPVVLGEDWSHRAPLVVVGLMLTSAGAWRLAASGGLLEHRKAIE